MIDTKLFDLFRKQNIDKQFEISYSGGTITNYELFSESVEIKESLCSESELRFGSCEASSIKFKISNVIIPLFNQNIGVQIKLEGHHDEPLQIGQYKVQSDTPTADRRWRDIVAYDAMYDILNADVADWYNTVFPDMESQMTMKEFRKKFLDFFDLEESNPDMVLVNDSMIVKKTVEPDQLSGKDVITSICEINGCFGHINREGKFAYIYLPQYVQGLYPANDLYPDHAPDYLPFQQETGHLYPQDPKGNVLGRQGTYISCKYEDYITKEIKRLQIRKEENDIGVILNESKEGNTYIIQNNFLVYGKGTDELKTIAQKIFDKISGIIYRPYNAELQGNPCFEVGDTIRLSTTYEMVESYVFERTLKGIQALRDSFLANGTEFYSENLNSTQNSIVELRGKSNVLTRTIEETKSELKDTENNLRSTITQTADQIKSEVEKADEGLSSRITQNANSISAEVTRATTEEGKLSGRISINESNITAEVTRATEEEETLSASIKVNADSIRSEVTRATEKEEEINGQLNSVNETLSSRITQNANSISAEVTRATKKEEEINGQLTSVNETLSSRITQTAESIAAEVTRATEEEGKLSASIKVNADAITSEVSRATETEGSLSSRITQNASSITAEVTRATEEEGALSTRITQNANSITTKVSKDSIISEINQTAETITIKANKIDLVGLVNTNEFVSKFATIETLNALSAQVDRIDADYVETSDFNALSATVSRIDADYASVGDLNALKATVDTIDANYITASEVRADYMEVDNWTSAGRIRADRIDVDSIITSVASNVESSLSRELYSGEITCGSLYVTSDNFSFGNASWENITVNGKTYTVLCK